MEKLFDGKFVYHVDVEKKTLSWQVNGDILPEEIGKIVDTLRREYKRLGKDILLFIDNSNVGAVFRQEVTDEWVKLQTEMLPSCKKIAVICNNITMKMQMNRLAKTSGISSIQEAFYEQDIQVAYTKAIEFLGVTKNTVRVLV